MNIVAIDTEAGWLLPVRKDAGTIVEVFENVSAKPSEKSTVPVFSARLQYEGHYRRNTHSVRHLFRDEQTGMVYRFSPKTMEALQHAILAGEIKVDTAHRVYEGLFTFQLFSKWVFVTPLDSVDRARLNL